jgi:two-component system, cell cycle response regulator DivK
MKILIVEDNPVNLELFRDLLEIAGHEILEAVTGYEAISMAKTRLPDLILMDIQLPDMDGYEAAMKLKEMPLTQKIPVVALTAHAMDGDREKALERGCDAYISKPIDTRTFVSEVEKALHPGNE